MTHTYDITGMSCGECVARAKSELLKTGGINEAKVQLQSPQATIDMETHIPVEILQKAINKAGDFTITEANGGRHKAVAEEKKSRFATYKPILVVFTYITGVATLIEIIADNFVWERWMQNFMAGFFMIFSLFKLLDLKGFAESYLSYDIIAGRWRNWGYVYAFIELALGLAYVLRLDPLITNITNLVVMSISIIGVFQSVLNKRKIKCACLGTVFNIPMSTVTLIEDGLMIAMSIIMLIALF